MISLYNYVSPVTLLVKSYCLWGIECVTISHCKTTIHSASSNVLTLTN